MKTAASLMTQLGDELIRDEEDLIDSNMWIRMTMTHTTLSGNKEEVYRKYLNTIRDATARMEDLLLQVKKAVTKLRNVADANATVDIDFTLKKVCLLLFTALPF